MADTKKSYELALAACDDQFETSVRKAYGVLDDALILTKTPPDIAAVVSRFTASILLSHKALNLAREACKSMENQ